MPQIGGLVKEYAPGTARRPAPAARGEFHIRLDRPRAAYYNPCMPKGSAGLERLRRHIDRVDDRLLELLNERMKLVEKVGSAKRAGGLPVADAARERDVVSRLLRANAGPLPDESLADIYREIFSAAKGLERPAAVAYLGPEATFSHLAALRAFGRAQVMLPMHDIREVFLAVEKGVCPRGVVPVENSAEGSVTPTLDMLLDTPLMVVDEIYLEIHHHLLSREEDLSKVRTIFSHPQALAQCREWLRAKCPRTEVTEVPSTAEAARQAHLTPRSAAIASELAARLYDLKIIARRIEDRFDNLTRFLVIGTEEQAPSGGDKTSLIFSIKDKAGALYHILEPLASSGINLTRIESRPSRRKAWDYVFFVDLAGHRRERRVARVLAALKGECPFFKVLGSYPNRKPEGRHR